MQASIRSVKENILKVPKITWIIVGIGISCLVAALVLTASNDSNHANLGSTSSSAKSSEAYGVLGSQSTDSGRADTESVENVNTSEPKPDSVTSRSNSPTANSGTASGSSNSGSQNTVTPKVPASSGATRTGYNLNEGWYFATAGTEGVFNSCWPAELNVNNEAQCIDDSNPYSRFWFEGIGISKSPEEAQEIAAAQAHHKALEKHIDPRRGGGGDAVILTESLCASYGLSCSRW